VESGTPRSTLLELIVRDLLMTGGAHLPEEAQDLDVTVWADLAQQASTRIRRPVQIRRVEGVLTAKVMDWPADAGELATSMHEIRRTIEELGGAVQLRP
jgi:hypothetical protein